ncbi:MAG TPA: glycosyltransferase family 9 protein [Pyrinomonadaceae bacterium]|nr:glycosyltransferase family 9 protein [Pyrinomonadaceae bacterium]
MSAIDWENVKRVLVVRLRSIGDTVLATPSLIALRRFLPDAQIDILLEDWVGPVLDGFDAIDSVLSIPTKNTQFYSEGKTVIAEDGLPSTYLKESKTPLADLFFFRSLIALELRKANYDVAFNLHGGTTATFFTNAIRAKHRVGLKSYRYSFLYNHLLSSPADFWHSGKLHSAEQQLALLGFVGIPVDDRPKTRLTVTDQGRTERVMALANAGQFALIHPTSAFFTKQWPVEKFARTAEFLAEKGLKTIAIASKSENAVLESLQREAKVPVTSIDDLTLPEIIALASEATIFVGNDSGIAHIAAAVDKPTVVIFGSSNRTHWRPWTDAPNEIVYEEFACQPCSGYECKEYGEPRCILSVKPEVVFAAIQRVLKFSGK